MARLANLVGALALLAAAAGCSQPVAARGRQVRLALTEYRLIPQDVDARQGRLTLFAHNYGRLTHNLAVMRGARTNGLTKPIPPGRTVRLIVYVSPGKYLMLSTLLSDRDLGIYGTLTVTR
jgi:hypothetical protein